MVGSRRRRSVGAAPAPERPTLELAAHPRDKVAVSTEVATVTLYTASPLGCTALIAQNVAIAERRVVLALGVAWPADVDVVVCVVPHVDYEVPPALDELVPEGGW